MSSNILGYLCIEKYILSELNNYDTLEMLILCGFSS